MEYDIRVIGIEVAKQHAVWGTYGKGGAEHCGGTCPKHPLRWKRLIDCDTDHLLLILATQRHESDLREIIRSILRDRGVQPINELTEFLGELAGWYWRGVVQ